MRYPSDWHFREFTIAGSVDELLIGFDSNPLPHNYAGAIQINISNRSLEDAITAAHGGMYESTPFEKESIEINGQDAIRLRYEDNTVSIWMSHGNNTFSFGGKEINMHEGTGILSTLKFIE